MFRKIRNMKTIVAILCIAALLIVQFATMYTEKEVEITEQQEIPIVFQTYSADLPENSDVEETFVSAGTPIYAMLSSTQTTRVGQIRYKQKIDDHFIFIPCLTSTGDLVWVGDVMTTISDMQGHSLTSVADLRDFWNSILSLVSENGSEFTIRGSITSLDPKAGLTLDSTFYGPLSVLSGGSSLVQSLMDENTAVSVAKFDSFRETLNDIVKEGKYLEAFQDSHTTRMVNVVTGKETKKELSNLFQILVDVEMLAVLIFIGYLIRRALSKSSKTR